jgi:hypothetical protein
MVKCKGKDWSTDPKTWLLLFIVGGVSTAIATAYVSKWLNITGTTNAKLRSQLQTAGIAPVA